MDGTRFDGWTRRRVGVAAGSAIIAVGRFARGDDALSKKRRKPLQFNQFGCVNVGDPCRGKDSVCCSGACRGRKPGRGENDKSRCVGHDASTCRAGQDSCAAAFVSCENGSSVFARCVRTTGRASYCAGDVFCRECSRDADCPVKEFEAGAACIVCGDCAENTACATLRTFA